MKNYILSLLGVFMFGVLFGQCPNDNFLWIDLTPTFLGHRPFTSCIFGGEYCTASVNAGETYRFSTCGGVAFDTEITIYDDLSGAFIGYNDDAPGCAPQSEFIWTATFTGVVRILVDAAPTCSPMSSCMNLEVEWTAAPPTSECGNALPAACGSTVTGNTIGDSPNAAGTCVTAVGTGGAQWYTFVGDGNTWTAETVTGSNYDTKIWVYTGSCGALSCVTGNDDGGVGTLSLVSFPTVLGQTYYIVVGGFGSAQGDYVMNVSNNMGCVAGCSPPGAPAVTDDYLCATGTATLTATASMGGTLEWYDASGNYVGTGTTYSPVVGTTTNFYVQENIGTGGVPGSITTTMLENNGQSGIMFDISAINSLTVNSFETNTDVAGNYEIYTKAGSHVGFETNAAAWTLVGTAVAVPNNPAGTPTPLPINVNVAISAGQTQAFYITLSDGSTGLNYTNGTAVGSVFSADANIQVKEGTGKAYAFGANYTPRVFNGIVHYTPGNSCSSPQSTATVVIGTAPTAPIALNDMVCEGESGFASVTSTSGNPVPVMNWYDAPTGGNMLGNGMNYTTPPMTNTVTYYVEEVGTGAGGAGSLQTTFADNNGQSGIMFDINALNSVTIQDFESNVDLMGDYEIYTKTGTHVGFEGNAGAWTLVGSATGVPNNPAGTATPIPIPVNVTIPAGQTQAFYITYSVGTGMNYTNGTLVGNVYVADANIEILEGTGKAYPFSTSFSPRIFNGIVNYVASGGCGPSPRVPVTVDMRRTEYALINSTTTTNSSCTVNESGVDWTYYYDNANPDDLLFAIAKDPNNLGNNNFTCDVAITVNNNPTTTGYYFAMDTTIAAAQFVMGRYWNVNITSGSMVDPVWVRFYYDPAEKARIVTEANNWAAIYGGSVGAIKHFKTVGADFNPFVDIYHSGIYNSIELVNNIDNLLSPNAINYVEYQGITSFSGGSITIGAEFILLGVDLLKFDAKLYNQDKSLVEWTVANDEKVESYELYHSSDAMSFDKISSSMPNSNSSQESEYSFIHENLTNGTNYYKLKIIYQDGTYEFSEIKAVEYSTNGILVAVQPNPFVGDFDVVIDASIEENIRLNLYNTIGELIYSKIADVEIGRNLIDVEGTTDWNSGNYVLEIKGKRFVSHKLITKK